MTPQQQEFDRQEKMVLEHLQRISGDVRDSITAIRLANKKLIKSELCLALVAADTFSRFHYLMLRPETGPVDSGMRFRDWVSRFAFHPNNEQYKRYRDSLKISADTLWEIRNSMLHFYGLPKPIIDTPSVIFGTIPDGFMRNTFKAAADQLGRKYKSIDPYRLINVLEEGLLTQLQWLIKMINESPQTYIEGIQRCYEVLSEEGAEFVDEERFNKDVAEIRARQGS